ncbi:MAG TPA: hypothetical protein VFQ27_01300 [Xanthobacteraceae bacterium]|nr:hypothetical protein [Xanthobacteraceae bacterium]
MFRTIRICKPFGWRALLGAAFAAAIGLPAAHAQFEPVIAVPGRPDVPVIINGYDATGAVVLGDWGLARPGAPVTVIDPGPVLRPLPSRGAYFPATGRRPLYGRREVDFPARTAPAERYHRSWSAESDMTPLAAPPPVPALDGLYPFRPPREPARHRARTK